MYRALLISFMLSISFKDVTLGKSCIESGELCLKDPASCLDEQVRSRIVSLLNREDFFFEENTKEILPYGCYLSLIPTVPYGDQCVPCAKLCTPGEERENKWEEMCQIYCYEERVRCSTASTKATTKMPDPSSNEPVLTASRIEDANPEQVETTKQASTSWRDWERRVPQPILWTILGIGLSVVLYYVGFLNYLWISKWRSPKK